MKLTAQLKLLPDAAQAKALLATLRAANAAATFAARVGFEAKVYGQVSIHRLCYKTIRERFKLPSNIAIRAIAKAVDSFSRDKTICPVFNPLGAIPYSDRLYRIASAQTISLATLTGRIRVGFVVGGYFAEILTRKMGEADLVYRDGQFYLHISTQFDEPLPIEAKDFLGVDLGIVNVACDSEGKAHSGEAIDRNRKRRATARKQYQRKGTKSAKRRLKKMSGRQARFQTWVNHGVSKQLVGRAKALGVGIVMEDLTHIRSRIEPTVSRKFRRRLGNWSFAQLRGFVAYKARLAGVPLVLVDPRNTSRTCSKCGHCAKGNRKSQGSFVCQHCGFSLNADWNAALNLRAIGLGQSKLPPKVVG